MTLRRGQIGTRKHYLAFCEELALEGSTHVS